MLLSPYINTKLYTNVALAPNQMNNEIHSHMKRNLIKRLEGKCYKHYGYITKIYEILERGDGVIHAENPISAAIYSVGFSCRLCIPLRNKFIICKVEATIQMLTSLSNGPIRVIITNDRINKDNFTIGKSGMLIKEGQNLKPLKSGDHVKVRIDSRKFDNKGSNIMCMGILESMASEADSKMFATEEYNVSEDFVDFDKYIQDEEKHEDMAEVGQETAEEIESDKQDLEMAK